MISARELKWIIRDRYAGREDAPGLKSDIGRLEKGEPLAYVIGWVPFLGTKIDLRYRPLIPRPETEFWTESVIKHIGRKKREVLDLFCGSGCTGLAVLKHCSGARVVFADLDPVAIKQTRLNLKLNKIPAGRHKVLRADVWLGIRGRFDVITANPPYVPSGRKPRLPLSVRNFEPHMALFAGPKGEDAISVFLTGLPAHLAPSGEAWLEFDSFRQMKPLIRRFPRLRFDLKKDQFGRFRFAKISLRDL